MLTMPRRKGFTHQIYYWLIAERNPKTLYAGTAIAVALFAVLTLGWGYIAGTNQYWQNPPFDAGTHLDGWLFYKQDGFRIPIFDTARMNAPDGASIIYTDSIPAVALVAKAVSALAPGDWNYLGFCVVVFYILTAVALLWLLQQLGISTILGAAFACIITCFNSLYNLQFESFFAQFFIIFSLGFYFRLRRHYKHRDMAVFTALVTLASLVHPYLFAMSSAIYVVTLGALLHTKKLTLKTSGMWLGIFAGLVAIVIFVSGHLNYTVTGYQEKLYGSSPVVALDVTTLLVKNYTIVDISTYFGMGIWLLALIGIVAMWRARPLFLRLIKSHVILISMCVAFLLFALSTTFFWNGSGLFHVPLPPMVMSVLETFRASKRFVIPLYYLIAIFGFVLAMRHKSRLVVGAVVVALVAQTIDLTFFVQDLNTSAQQGQKTVLDQNYWKTQLAGAKQLNVYPSYSCLFNYRTTPLTGDAWLADLNFVHIAAMSHVISNSVRTAKRTKDCDAEAKTAHQTPAVGSVNVYIKDANNVFILRPSAECVAHGRTFDFGMYCK